MQNSLPKNWQKVKLGELLEGVVDNRGKTPPLSASGYPMVEVYQLSRDSKYPNVNYDSKQKYVSESTYNGWFRAGHPKSGDLLISTVGTISQWNLVPESPHYCIAQNVVALRPDTEKTSAEFLRHYFNQKKFIGQVQGIAIGAAQPSVRLPHFLNLEVDVPEKVTDQKKIVSILSAFDDKIEVNNKIANTLGQTAQTIFKEWFVDFRFPGYKKEKFIDSELGKIPKGWKVKKLGEIMEFAYGKGLKEKVRKKGDVLVIGSSGVVGRHNEKLVSGPGIVVGRKGTVGSIQWIDDDFYPIDTTFYIKSKLSLYFCYFLLKRQRFITGDSAVPGLNRNQAYLNNVIVFPESLVKSFENVVKPMFGKRNLILKESQKLSRMRDLLLPKLMRGEIKV